MKKSILIVLVDQRHKNAVRVQKILTTWGCLIKTRLGIHDGILDNCSETGLLILELVGDKKKQQMMLGRLKVLPGVAAKLVEIGLKK
jgi:hypothetical protein